MIEEKLSRLTTDQQREVEDFIDFLIARDSNSTINIHNHENGGTFTRVREDLPQPAPMIFADERPVAGRIDQDILPDYPEYRNGETIGKVQEPERRIVIPRRAEKEPGRLLDWID